MREKSQVKAYKPQARLHKVRYTKRRDRSHYHTAEKGRTIIFDTDERPMDTTLEKMARLKAVFKKDGTVTAGMHPA